MKVTKVIVKVPKQGRKKYRVLHDKDITPPCDSAQILAALKQQYEVLSFVIEDGVATSLVQRKPDETE
jgi:hypothetical protein